MAGYMDKLKKATSSTNRLRGKLAAKSAKKRAGIEAGRAARKASKMGSSAKKSATAAADAVKRRTGYGATSIAPTKSKRPKARSGTGLLGRNKAAASKAKSLTVSKQKSRAAQVKKNRSRPDNKN